jgi:hypothetical protein
MAENGKEEIKPKCELAIVRDDSEAGALLDSSRFEHLWRVANLFSKSNLLPEHFQNKPENCMIALASALRSKIDPMLFLQHTYVVGSKLGIDGQIAIAMLNSRGGFKGGVKFKWVGEKGKDTFGCVAYGIDAATGEVLEGPAVTMEVVKAEGWLGKTGSKWKTIPDLMFMYRAASWFGRTHRPEVLMGFPTSEELEEQRELKNVTPGAELPSEIAQRMEQQEDKICSEQGCERAATIGEVCGLHPKSGALPPESVRLDTDHQNPDDLINEAQQKVITGAAKAMGEMAFIALLDARGFKEIGLVTAAGFPMVLQDILKAGKGK